MNQEGAQIISLCGAGGSRGGEENHKAHDQGMKEKKREKEPFIGSIRQRINYLKPRKQWRRVSKNRIEQKSDVIVAW